MKPPSSAPAIPIRIVTMKPPGSRPGINSLAMMPTTSPNRIHDRIPISFPPFPGHADCMWHTKDPDLNGSVASVTRSHVRMTLDADAHLYRGHYPAGSWRPGGHDG